MYKVIPDSERTHYAFRLLEDLNNQDKNRVQTFLPWLKKKLVENSTNMEIELLLFAIVEHCGLHKKTNYILDDVEFIRRFHVLNDKNAFNYITKV